MFPLEVHAKKLKTRKAIEAEDTQLIHPEAVSRTEVQNAFSVQSHFIKGDGLRSYVRGITGLGQRGKKVNI